MTQLYDFRAQRLFVTNDLAARATLALPRDQANYLLNVLRLTDGDPVHVFNGRDGEWRALVSRQGKRFCHLAVERLLREQVGGPDLWYVFAPLKRSRLDYMVQKAVEMGASRLVPVVTRYTIAERVNLDRMRANVIEAAEQCGILRVPEVAEPLPLDRVLDGWSAARRLVLADEAAPVRDPIAALRAVEPGPLAVLIGPEGGFAEEERSELLSRPFVVRLALGPRIMRADTAAVAALALVDAVLGDWR
ncbi:MAG: 16S rRNA (uracil(1498)-N(3))-methyltransferase [Hyphomicrobiaceae bacterium]|nr:16S rRNA (uracil(1498)-N(3))-methyltransferase [Hyphomicrobiaceae bacterium]